MAIQNIGGQNVYVITGSQQDPRLQSSGQSWANAVSQQKFRIYDMAMKETLAQMQREGATYDAQMQAFNDYRNQLLKTKGDLVKAQDKIASDASKEALAIQKGNAVSWSTTKRVGGTTPKDDVSSQRQRLQKEKETAEEDRQKAQKSLDIQTSTIKDPTITSNLEQYKQDVQGAIDRGEDPNQVKMQGEDTLSATNKPVVALAKSAIRTERQKEARKAEIDREIAGLGVPQEEVPFVPTTTTRGQTKLKPTQTPEDVATRQKKIQDEIDAITAELQRLQAPTAPTGSLLERTATTAREIAGTPTRQARIPEPQQGIPQPIQDKMEVLGRSKQIADSFLSDYPKSVPKEIEQQYRRDTLAREMQGLPPKAFEPLEYGIGVPMKTEEGKSGRYTTGLESISGLSQESIKPAFDEYKPEFSWMKEDVETKKLLEQQKQEMPSMQEALAPPPTPTVNASNIAFSGIALYEKNPIELASYVMKQIQSLPSKKDKILTLVNIEKAIKQTNYPEESLKQYKQALKSNIVSSVTDSILATTPNSLKRTDAIAQKAEQDMMYKTPEQRKQVGKEVGKQTRKVIDSLYNPSRSATQEQKDKLYQSALNQITTTPILTDEQRQQAIDYLVTKHMLDAPYQQPVQVEEQAVESTPTETVIESSTIDATIGE
jgi:hypothetical protein